MLDRISYGIPSATVYSDGISTVNLKASGVLVEVEILELSLLVTCNA